MHFGERKKHESFGMLSISRVHGAEKPLFGSSIKHGNTITLRVKRGEVERHLNNDWYSGRGLPLIEIEMSLTQFAEAITSMNYGDGIPVTIKTFNGEYMEECPFDGKRQLFEQEFDNRMSKIGADLKSLTVGAKELLTQKKPPTKGERDEILNAIKKLEMEILSNIPFINSQFNGQMEKTVLECKGEIEGFVQSKIQHLGLEELRKQMPTIDEGRHTEMKDVEVELIE